MWKEDKLHVQYFSSSPWGIHATVKVSFNPNIFLFYVIYVSPDLNMRLML